MKKEKLAFKQSERGFTIKVYYLLEPKGDALVELFYGKKKVRKMLYPAYKIWNLSAHFSDIVDSEINNNTRGYEIAGDTFLGGCVMPTDIN